MKRTREKIFAKHRQEEPEDHLGRELKAFKEVTSDVLEILEKTEKKEKKEKKGEVVK